MTKKIYKIEGKDFDRVKFILDEQDAFEAHVDKEIKALQKRLNKEANKIHEQLWEAIYEILKIDPEGTYKINKDGVDAGVILVAETGDEDDRKKSLIEGLLKALAK